MDHFYKLLSKKEQVFIDDLFNTSVTITEKIDGQAFSVEKNGNDWTFYKRNAKEPINVLDRTISKQYEGLIEFFESKDKNILKKIPDGYRFEMEYVKTLKPNLISYDELPKNNLILHSISLYKNGKLSQKIEDIKKINSFADLLDVATIPVIFQGKLNDRQKEGIKSFLQTDQMELIQRFKTDSFTQYIFSILDPSREKTYLQKDLSKPIEGIVFYFDEKTILAKLVDPTFEETIKDKKVQQKEESDEHTNEDLEIFVQTFLSFLDSIHLNDYVNPKLKSGLVGYVQLMGNIFLEFYNKNKTLIHQKFSKLADNQLDVFKQEEFQLNDKFIPEDLKKLIKKHDFLSYLFKNILMTYRITKKRFTNTSKDIVKKIQDLQLVLKEHKGFTFIKFSEFINENLNENLNEGMDLPKGHKNANLIIGKFQPFTLGHMKMVEKMKKLNGLPTYIISVRRKNPLISDSTSIKMFDILKKELKNEICEFSLIDKGLLGWAINECRKNDYEISLIGCGTDRVADYTKQLKYIKDNDIVSDSVELIEIARTDDDISATKVREAILNNDLKYLKQSIPNCLLKFVDKIKKDLEENA